MEQGMDELTVRQTLDTIKQIKRKHLFCDMHMHPFEVMFPAFRNRLNRSGRGLFSTSDSGYTSPQISALNLDGDPKVDGGKLDRRLWGKLCLLNARRFYQHTGARVFIDQMKLCGIDRALLLPVVGSEEDKDDQVEMMGKMFRGERFMFGYSVPNSVPNDSIAENVRKTVSKHKVKVLKIHPAITGIDLAHSVGINRVEHILKAASQSGLGVVVHGGLSPECPEVKAVRYGVAKNLQHVDWALSSGPVVIAHGGLYGHTIDEVRNKILPEILKLMQHYPHIVVDTSGIDFESLCHLLECVDAGRIIFGSDALYEKPWMALVKLWSALGRTARDPEGALIRIASKNPLSFLSRTAGSGHEDNSFFNKGHLLGGTKSLTDNGEGLRGSFD
jgi:hypothetical protein